MNETHFLIESPVKTTSKELQLSRSFEVMMINNFPNKLYVTQSR